MSVNWHYFKHLQTSVKNRAVREVTSYAIGNGTAKDLKQLTDYTVDQREIEKNGRAWRAEELRLKSHSDLHKLWYVLLKEKNKLKSDFLMAKQMQQLFFGFDSMSKVQLSMARLLTVVNERKKLRNEYRAELEDKYIEEMQKADKNSEYYKNEKMKEVLRAKSQKIRRSLIREDKAMDERFKQSTNYTGRDVEKDGEALVNLAPTLTPKDMRFIASNQVKMPQKDIMKLYVGNYHQLTLKQRRQVASFIQAQRSKHAKEIFLKELSAIGRNFNNQANNADAPEVVLVPNSRIVGQKDPLKLKLEQIKF